MSCDSYSDAWGYFALCWDKFWVDCPFDVYLISEEKEFHHPRIKNIKIGRKVGWADMLLETLSHIDTERIIYMQEDYLLKGEINNNRLFECLNVFETQGAAYLRLFPWPNPEGELVDGKEIGVINSESKYKTSLQCAVWDKSVLQKLTYAGESGWDFEEKSIKRSEDIGKPFLSIYKDISFEKLNSNSFPIDYFATGILNGKWMIECIRYFKVLGIIIDPGERGVLNKWDYFYYQYKKVNNNKFYTFLNRSVFRKPWFNKLYFKFLKLVKMV